MGTRGGPEQNYYMEAMERLAEATMETIASELNAHGIKTSKVRMDGYPLERDKEEYREHGYDWSDEAKAERWGYSFSVPSIIEVDPIKHVVASMKIVSKMSTWPVIEIEVWHHVKGVEVTEVDIEDENVIERLLAIYKKYMEENEA